MIRSPEGPRESGVHELPQRRLGAGPRFGYLLISVNLNAWIGPVNALDGSCAGSPSRSPLQTLPWQSDSSLSATGSVSYIKSPNGPEVADGAQVSMSATSRS